MFESHILIAHGRQTHVAAHALMADLHQLSPEVAVDVLSSPSKTLLLAAAFEPQVAGLALIEDKAWLSTFTALRWLRAQYALKTLQIIVVTSFLDPGHDAKLLSEGANGVAMTPLAATGYRRLAKSLLRTTGTKGGSGVRSGVRTSIQRRR
jgi:hypothetical protein